MRIIFCADYWNPLSPDSAYEAEATAVERLELTSSLINFDALVEQQNTARAVRKVEPTRTQEMTIYRGWMLKPYLYERLFIVLAEKGLLLINTPAAYTHCHYLPESYPLIENVTPRSTWLHPEILLHNNPAELGARQRVRKRAVSLQARTREGIAAWEDAGRDCQQAWGQCLPVFS